MKENAVGLPEGWKTATLGTVCEKVKAVKRKEVDPEGELIYLDIGGLDNDRNIIREHKIYQWKDAPSRAQQIVEVGDVLFSTVRTYMKNIALVDQQRYHHQIASSGFCVLRPQKGRVASKFIFYYSISQCFLQPLNELQTGSSYPAVRDKDVFAQEIPLPPPAEQERIVSKIEELFSELEKGKEQILLAQQQLKTYRQAVLKWAFEGRLTNADVVDGALPEGWEWVEFGSSFSESPQNGLYKPSTEYGSGVPIIRIDSFYEGVIDPSFDFKRVRLTREETKSYEIAVDDILVNRVNSIQYLGKCGLVRHLKEPMVFESNMMRIRLDQEKAIPSFICYYLSSTAGKREIRKNSKHAVNQASINQKDVAATLIPLPKTKEQHRIVQEIESRLSVCDALEAALQTSLAQAEVLRQSVLKRAFEGRLI